MASEWRRSVEDGTQKPESVFSRRVLGGTQKTTSVCSRNIQGGSQKMATVCRRKFEGGGQNWRQCEGAVKRLAAKGGLNVQAKCRGVHPKYCDCVQANF
jgi:hypothetical protein